METSTSNWWLAPSWLDEALRDARARLDASRAAYERMKKNDLRYAKSMRAMIRARAEIVSVLERHLLEARKGPPE